jgi:hypothetical protein
MKLAQLWNVSTALSSTPASTADFGVPALLVDHSDVPLDIVYRTVSQSSYATDLTASTDQTSWCASLWGQNYNPALAYIVRWISAASSPYFVRGPNAQTTVATWAAVTDGSLTVTTTAGADALTAIDFTGDTTMTDVAATINAALTAGGTSGATCTLDALDRIIFTDPAVTGTGSDTVLLSGGGGGTDLYLPAWLDAANGWQVGGLDIEPLSTAMNRCLALTDAPYAMHERGGSVAQVTAFSTAVNALNKILHLRESDVTAKTATTTDFSYAISALSHARTYGIYTEHTVANGASLDQNPDVVFCGEILPRPEGSTSYANMPLASVSESGLDNNGTTVIPLTDGERAYLEGKSCDYLIKPADKTHARNGLSYGGQEMRVMVGRDWFNYWVMFDTYAYVLARQVVTFSDTDLSAIKSIIIKHADTLVDRKCLEAGYTINMPLASSFTSTQKATHTLTLSEVLTADVQIAINDGVITMSWAA